jgi:rfaE bifunctional protein kinase chain/domain
MTKVFRLSEFSSTDNLQWLNGAIACFGHFNAIHPGHIRYFRTAREHGRPLVVAVEGDAQLPNLERASVFPEEERAQSVASLNLVDYVVILDSGPLEEFVGEANLAALVLGKEFEGARAPKVAAAVIAAQNNGAQVFYGAGETHYASTELLSGSPGELKKQRCEAFIQAQKAQGVVMSDVFSIMEQGHQPHILVIGDAIVDRYVACDPVGVSNEAPVVVFKEMETRDYVGGAGIVAAHVAALGARSTFLSVTGKDSHAQYTGDMLSNFGVDSLLIEDESRPTTFKIRYLVENQKLFRVSRLKEHSLPRKIEDQLVDNIIEKAADLDGILVSDFVYGVITPRIIETLRHVSREHDIPLFGDLQCSSQVGNILKFKDFFFICPTEREARIALANHDDGVEYIANLLIEKTRNTNMVLKLAGEGFIVYVGQEGEAGFLHRQHFPALTVNPVDVAGAGDALLSAMTVGLARGLSLMQASALACCVSAIAVQTVGNRPISLKQARQFYLQYMDSGQNNAV